MGEFFKENLSTILLIGIPVIALLCFIAAGYVKAPPDTAIIISGLRKKPKVLIGKAGIKIPLFERTDKLQLKQVTIDVKTEQHIPTLDFINIQVDAVVKVRVSTESEKMELAMKNFLNKNSKEIMLDLQDSLQGNMREIIGTMTLQNICNNRDEFGNQVQSKAQVDMDKLGMEIISCNIQNIADKNGLIENMGMENTSKIKKDAAIAKAQADRDVAIAQAEADKQANDAKVASQTEIAERNNELDIKKAELKIISDQKKADADAAYQIQEQIQRKNIEISKADADVAKQEKMAVVKKAEADVEEQVLAAQIKKKADAERYAAEQKAAVELFQRQKDAEAKLYEEEQEAEALKKKAEAEKYAAEQRAEGIRLVGQAEAEAIRAKGVAEAEGIDKKAEAMRKMGEASVLEMFFNAYPQIMAAAAKPLENVEQIMMFGEGNSSKMVGDIVNSTKQVIEGVKASTGVDLTAILSGFIGGSIQDKLKGSNNTSEKDNVEIFEEKSEEKCENKSTNNLWRDLCDDINL